jgi:hypothetical protein
VKLQTHLCESSKTAVDESECFFLFSATRKSVASPPSATQQADGILIENTDVALVGLAVSWECYDAYYISLTASTIAGKCQ